MAQTLTANSSFNHFAVFREIMQGITALTALDSKWSSNSRYYEDEPNIKSSSDIGYPYMIIETDTDDEHISYKGLKQMNCTTNVTIRTDYTVERPTPHLNAWMNAINDYFNENQGTLLDTYGIDGIRISKARDKDVIAERQIIVGLLTFDYNVKLDVEA